MAFDPTKFMSPVTPMGSYDYGAGFRALAGQRMRQSENTEQARQADQSEAGIQKRHDATSAFNNKSLNSQNARFSLELEDNQKVRQGEFDKNKAAKVGAATAAFREKIAKTDFSGADSMIGSLAEMGVEVNRSTDAQGMPVYRVKAPTFGERPGVMDSATIMDKIEGGVSQKERPQENQPSKGQSSGEGFQFPGSVRQISGETEIDSTPPREPDPKNPFEPAGTTGEFVAPPHPESNDIFTAPGEQPLSAAEVEQQRNPVVNEKNPYDPYMINTGDMLEQNRKRIDPMLSGVVGATPGRFQGRMKNYMSGVREMGLPLDQTMDTMQKPLDTVAGLMKGEMSAEAARARASMSSENQGANRNLRIEDTTWKRASEVGKSFELTKRKIKLNKVNETINHLGKNNRSADGLLISTIRSMFETGVMTDRDFANTKSGIKSIFQQIKDGVDEKVIGTGLNPDSRAGLTAFMKDIAKDDISAVNQAQDQLMIQAERAQSQEEQNTIIDFITSNVPQDLWNDDIKRMHGIPVEQKTGPVDKAGNYSTKSGGVSQKEHPGEPSGKKSVTVDVNSEVEELLK
jgi:hypothetical protein